MIPSLQKISDSIPDTSVKVRHYFIQATTPDDVTYPFFMRYVYASGAVIGAGLGALGYALTIMSSIATALLYGNPNLRIESVRNARRIHDSLYFAAVMTAYLFMTALPWSSYNLKLEPLPIPLELRKEATAYVLKSSVDLDFNLSEHEIQGTEFKLFADLIPFENRPIADINHLLGILHSRPDYVLINAPGSKAYLVPRNDEKVTAGILNGTMVLYELAPVEVEIPESDSLANSILVQSFHKPSEPVKDEPSLPVAAVSLKPAAQPEAPAPSSKWGIGRLVGYEHLSKEMKYRHIIANHIRAVTSGEGAALFVQVEQSPGSPLKEKCLELYRIITKPQNYEDIRAQHKAFILALREAENLTKAHPANPACRAWIDFLALERFTKVKLYGYCKKLVESVEEGFKIPPLTLDNFWEHFESIVKKVKNIPVKQGIPKPVEVVQNLGGHFNMKDFLLTSNIPYIYGQIKKEGEKSVTVLRHGTPFAHYEPLGVIKRLIWGEAGNTIPEITSDYLAFVDAAGREGKNILHLIAENGDWKYQGDESSRFKGRLTLASKPNVFPIAFRFDGPSIEPKNYSPRTIDAVKAEFLADMYGDNTGYYVPGKLQQTVLTKKHFTDFMDSVQRTFFAGQEKLETLGDFQAFKMLTYAEIILSLCDTLDITYLEAHCKDDIDRGGAMKAIIILLHLYRTGKFREENKEQLSQALEELMVSIHAAPLIVKKKQILDHRSHFIKNVIDVLRRVVHAKPVPDESYNGNFNVLSEPLQELIPTGGTCLTEKEYQTFLGLVKDGKITVQSMNDSVSPFEILQPLFVNGPLQINFLGTADDPTLFKVTGKNPENVIARVRAVIEKPGANIKLTVEVVA